jgi:O-antigen ligase
MIRLTLLYLFVAAIMTVSLRYWFTAVCGLVLLAVFTQHPSMPTQMFGIQGLNPWNAAFLVVFVSWLLHRRHDPPRAPIPPGVIGLFGLFATLIVASGLVAAFDASSIQGPAEGRVGFVAVLVDTIINPLKYLLIGLLFFDGARSRLRVRMALITSIGSAFCYGFLLFKSLGARVFTIDFEDARRMTDKLVGLFANDLAELFAFALWGGLFLIPLFQFRWHRALWLASLAAVVPPFLALKSRAGFLSFCVVGLVLGLVRSRRILVLLPIAILVVGLLSPGVRERIAMGVGHREQETSWDEISAGRVTNIWPPTISQIAMSPILGHGRLAILREPCYDEILELERNVPNHPHCSYLELLLDAGLVGLGIGLACALGLALGARRLMRESHDPLISALGTCALAALITELAAGLTGSSFFPSQSSVPYLCIWGTALGVCAQRAAVRMTAPAHAMALSFPSGKRWSGGQVLEPAHD